MQSGQRINCVPGTMLLAAALLGACEYKIPNEAPAMRHYSAEVSMAIAEWSRDYDACEPGSLSVAIVDGDLRLQLTARRGRKTLPARALRAVLRSAERGGKPETLVHVRRDSAALAGAAE